MIGVDAELLDVDADARPALVLGEALPIGSRRPEQPQREPLQEREQSAHSSNDELGDVDDDHGASHEVTSGVGQQVFTLLIGLQH